MINIIIKESHVISERSLHLPGMEDVPPAQPLSPGRPTNQSRSSRSIEREGRHLQ